MEASNYGQHTVEGFVLLPLSCLPPSFLFQWNGVVEEEKMFEQPKQVSFLFRCSAAKNESNVVL